jgi:hypothetical protein
MLEQLMHTAAKAEPCKLASRIADELGTLILIGWVKNQHPIRISEGYPYWWWGRRWWRGTITLCVTFTGL